MHCVPAAQRETIFNFADENGRDEAVQLDRRDSRGLPETCERRDWRIRDPTWRKRDPTWRKSDELGEKANFVGEKKIIHISQPEQEPPGLLHEAFDEEIGKEQVLAFVLFDPPASPGGSLPRGSPRRAARALRHAPGSWRRGSDPASETFGRGLP